VSECQIEADRQVLRSWYNNFCAQVKNGIDPTTTTSTVAGSNPTVATSTLNISSGTAAATVTVTSTATASHANQTWIGGHWKWVLMLVVLVVGLIALTWLAIWLKRRHRRKIEAQRAALSGFGHDPEGRPTNIIRHSATPSLWGPHQMMQATQGYAYSSVETEGPVPVSAPGKRASRKMRKVENTRQSKKDMMEITEVGRRFDSANPPTTRARPSELETNAKLIGAADRLSKNRNKRDDNHGLHDKSIEAGWSERLQSKSRSRGVDFEKT